MTGFERATLAGVGASLLFSGVLALARGEEEFRRRAGLKGTSVLLDGDGRAIEYVLSRAGSTRTRPVLLLENGLGSPLESWDWIEYLLKDEVDILRYHRRGYARTKSRRRPAEIVERLVVELAPGQPIIIAGHSLGALVAANVVAQSEAIEERLKALFVIDGTDGELLDEDRTTPERVGRFRQMALQEAVGQVLGVNRWVPSKFERDVEYRPDVQRAFVIATTSVRTQIASLREYLHESTDGQVALSSSTIPVHVVSASDNVPQQTRLAQRLNAELSVVPGSSHRSIIGRLSCATVVADRIREVVRAL